MGLNETVDLLANLRSMCWFGYVSMREEVHILKMAVCIEVKVQRGSVCLRVFEGAGSRGGFWFWKGEHFVDLVKLLVLIGWCI